MTDQVETTIGTCKWRLDGRCYRRLKHRCCVPNGSRASRRSCRVPMALDVLDHLRMNGEGEKLPKCDAVDGSPCPHLPIFDGRVLHFRGEVLLEFSRRCRQAELVEALQLQGWPDVIEMPHWPKNRRSKTVFELNQRHRRQHSRRQIHFWCGDSGVHWKVVGEPAPFPAPVRSAPMVGHD